MRFNQRLTCGLAAKAIAAMVALVVLAASPARAGTVIDDWNNIKVPAPPELKPVTIAPATTALLMLDFVHPICSEKNAPRCVASLPATKQLLAEARAHHVMVVFSTAGTTTTQDIWGDVAPLPGEPAVNSHANKFQNTELEKILRDKGITTVITVGTAANGAVLYTASEAAFRGFKVIVPVDGSTASDEYIEQYVVYNLAHAPGISANITLTATGMIKY